MSGRRLSTSELAGFALAIAAFIAVMALFDVEPRSWEAFVFLAAFLAFVFGYRRALVKRRQSNG
jgi:ABC-type polysaccharide/polyol phosphate export permease